MEYLPVFSIFIAIFGFLFQQFGVISEMKERLVSLETKMEIFWKAIESNLGSMLKSYPSNLEKDLLLDKMMRKELTLEDAERLRTIIIGEMETNNGDEVKKIAYVLLGARIDQIIFDIKKSIKIS